MNDLALCIRSRHEVGDITRDGIVVFPGQVERHLAAGAFRVRKRQQHAKSAEFNTCQVDARDQFIHRVGPPLRIIDERLEVGHVRVIGNRFGRRLPFFIVRDMPDFRHEVEPPRDLNKRVSRMSKARAAHDGSPESMAGTAALASSLRIATSRTSGPSSGFLTTAGSFSTADSFGMRVRSMPAGPMVVASCRLLTP